MNGERDLVIESANAQVAEPADCVICRRKGTGQGYIADLSLAVFRDRGDDQMYNSNALPPLSSDKKDVKDVDL